MSEPVTLYHVASRDDSLMILAEGFRETPSHWLPHRPERGVWLTERPLDANDGLPDDWNTVVEVQFELAAEELVVWRWTTDENAAEGVPELLAWLFPTEVVRTRGRTRLLEQTELSESEVREALQRREVFLRKLGRVGEQLEEEMATFEDFIRRWEPE